jgi:thioredoxin
LPEVSRVSPHIHATDLDRFEADVVEASRRKPVLVDFWAEWCSPCLVVAPVLESIVESMGGELKLVKVEVDDGENMKLAGHYRVRGFPTVMLFRDGRELGRFSGARSHTQVMAFLHEHLDPDLPAAR